ncbi:cellular nucleic acid-binding protein, partial [Trifolium medium]|nr:cellular nucleic acid-binding protein [Trifolium medium]
IDTGATHSFISINCVNRLNIPVTEISSCMKIETPSSGSVTTQCDFRDELVDIQSCPYQLLCEDGCISEAGGGFTIDE